MTTTPATTAPTAADFDRITQQLAYATAQLEAWKEQRQEAIDLLDQLHAAGIAPTKFDAYGYSFALQTGKKSQVKDTEAKLALERLQADLIRDGHITETVGSPFWTLRKGKTPKA